MTQVLTSNDLWIVVPKEANCIPYLAAVARSIGEVQFVDSQRIVVAVREPSKLGVLQEDGLVKCLTRAADCHPFKLELAADWRRDLPRAKATLYALAEEFLVQDQVYLDEIDGGLIANATLKVAAFFSNIRIVEKITQLDTQIGECA